MISIWNKNRVGGRIRGEQICKYAGFRNNPTEGYENDVCIFVKRAPEVGKYKALYIDPIDMMHYVDVAKNIPDCGVIATSLVGKDFLGSYMTNKIVCIPQQHCNTERLKRTRTEIKTVGFCGQRETFDHYEEGIRKRLELLNLDLKVSYIYKTREDIVDFYKSIDIQIIWRDMSKGFPAQLKNPLKISNAGSFGIPTVAGFEDNFTAEYRGCYLPVFSINDLIAQVEELTKNEKLYNDISAKVLERAEEYHIDNIVKLYRALDV